MEKIYMEFQGSSDIISTSSKIKFWNYVDHLFARLGIMRYKHIVKPGLYSLRRPCPDSPVFVTANYTLSFDALRSSLSDIDAYILVLNTEGINVWCAAGKGTFGTDELLKSIERVGLHNIVKHRTLILPQLGATGVSANEVKRRSGFKVEYGPVRASDIPEYLKNHIATTNMRTVKFNIIDRLILIPVEIVHIILPLMVIGIGVYFLAGKTASIGIVLSMLSGVILFPILLPYIPTPNFSTKGFILGGIITLPFVIMALHENTGWQRITISAAYLLTLPSITAFLSLNFTGATTFTSRTGVRREITRYFPIMLISLLSGIFIAFLTRII